MQKVSYVIEGGFPIYGNITCMGAKNLATKAIVASLLSLEPTILRGVPRIGDVDITKELLVSAGVKIDWQYDIDTMYIDPSTLTECEASFQDSNTNRVPILLLSVLLHKFGKGSVPIVGGDHIGKRDIDYHLTAIKSFGADVYKKNNKYYTQSDGRLRASHITLPYPSVGATETCLFLSVLAQGTSVIRNIALEPEVIELITMLNSMGAIIFINDNREIVVRGVEKLIGTRFFIAGDRIEAASWAALACASGGRIKVSGIRTGLLANFLPYYNKIGGGFKFLDSNAILFFRKEHLKATKIETGFYPGFATDWQQPFVTILTQADGISMVHETVYEKRLGYLGILNELGAKTEVITSCLGSSICRYKRQDQPHSALIYGPTQLQSISKPIVVPDLRAGLAYLIAAVIAKGQTIINSAEQIERGYGNLEQKLKNTNIKIKRLIN